MSLVSQFCRKDLYLLIVTVLPAQNMMVYYPLHHEYQQENAQNNNTHFNGFKIQRNTFAKK